MKINLLALFFVIDHSHAQKRVLIFKNNVEKLTLVSYHRNKSIKYENHHDLGKIPQNKYLYRFLKIIFDIRQLSKILSNNPEINVVYVWNFDAALLFLLTKLFSKQKYRVIYDVIDIKPILLSKSIMGKILRKLEQYILDSTDYLCVTSEDFIINYFDKYYIYERNIHIVENKVFPEIDNTLINNDLYKKPDNTTWRIGFVGLFRCNTSLKLLLDLAKCLPEKVEIILAGRPEEHVIDTFNKLVNMENTVDMGEYAYPNGLPDIYSKIDIVWSADFSDLSVNSKWLLPNRIYEAGIFSVPHLCFSDNIAISKYIKSLKIGWILEDADIETLLQFFSSLTLEQFQQIKSNYDSLPTKQFSGDEQMQSLLNDIKDKLQ